MKTKQTKNKKSSTTKIFVNLPVKDLNKSIKFFTKIGFKFNPKFTDKNATCIIISEDIYSMLIVEKMFKTFTNKPISNAKKTTEVLLCLSFNSKKKVDELTNKALKAGAKETRKSYDYGWMYGRVIEDLDGHIWEFFYMNEKARPKN